MEKARLSLFGAADVTLSLPYFLFATKASKSRLFSRHDVRWLRDAFSSIMIIIGFMSHAGHARGRIIAEPSPQCSFRGRSAT